MLAFHVLYNGEKLFLNTKKSLINYYVYHVSFGSLSVLFVARNGTDRNFGFFLLYSAKLKKVFCWL